MPRRVSLEHQRLDNPVDKRRAGHIVVRTDVHLAAQLVFDPDVTGLRVFHQMDGHTRDQPRDRVHCRTDFGILRKAHVSPALDRFPQVCARKSDAPAHRLGARRRPASFFLAQASPHHFFATLFFSRLSRYRMQANTDASKRSMRCSGCTLSYWIMSSVFSTADTFSTQYS